MFDLELFMSELKLTQNELAIVLSVSQTAISKVKNGKMDIPEGWLPILKLHYDVDYEKYYVIHKDDNIINEPQSLYNSNPDSREYLLQSIFNLTESNKILAFSVSEAIRLNGVLIDKLHLELA